MSSLISIAMSAHNYARYIPEAIDSVKAQTYANWELNIVDDASEDDTENVVRAYLCEDSRIHYKKNTVNQGPNKTWNTAMKMAKGDFCCCLDADDTFPNDSLENRIETINGYDVLYTDMFKIMGSKKELLVQDDISDHVTLAENLRQFRMNLASALYKCDVFDKIGFRTDTYGSHADYALAFEVLCKCKVGILHKPTYNYHFRNSTSAVSYNAYKNVKEVELFEQLLKDYAIILKAVAG